VTNTSQTIPKIRIANFSDIHLPQDNVLTFENQNVETIVTTIRAFADRPFVYLFSAKQAGTVTEVLSRLKSIRSPCYPYALFITDGDYDKVADQSLEIIPLQSVVVDEILASVNQYALSKFVFDMDRLNNNNTSALPGQVDVLIVGGGITGLYAANRLKEKQISFCLIEARDIAGGIWSEYANTTSQVNTSEGAYRALEKDARTNRDHSSTTEILEDLHQLSQNISANLYTGCKAERIEKIDGLYQTQVAREEEAITISSKGIILAVNDRIGSPRAITYEDQQLFNGTICSGASNETQGLDWRGKKVVVVGMGAFAVENVRTALENGASHVTVVCRRHGTVCPKIIDYLNFATPYDEKFAHDRKSNIRNMMLWKKLYDQSNATQPECWMGKIKHEGHTISVSDIWFIAHYLKKLETVSGSISAMYDNGVIVDNQHRIDADILVNCVGFHRNSSVVMEMTDYEEMFNNNYIDKDLMYLADAFIDDDVFNSFFGSSVLEMTKFYMDVYIDFFNSPEYKIMSQSDGIEKIGINDRRWSHYIAGADALIANYPRFYQTAKSQITQRTANFLEIHDLGTYIAANKREWLATHALLSGKPMKEEECLPYVFEKLIEKKL